jgi:hypothetical protein
MVKKVGSRRSYSSSRSYRRSRSYRQRGGYSSAATYGMEVNGTGPEQYARTFSMDSPYAGRIGTGYVGAEGQWSHQPGSPTSQQLALVQSAGLRISRAGRRRKKGGFLGPVISQAIVPATILGLQQTYRRKGNSGNRTFRHRRFSRRR